MVKKAIYISTYHTTGDVNLLVEMAQLAEESGWMDFLCGTIFIQMKRSIH
ncbi:MAG: hypothetical protein GPJ54_21585 [Candidatus Heimdallarchaeota archaeon]|nr:hypothetical protein [Candidatus Heimdallarchaeota archaeon]